MVEDHFKSAGYRLCQPSANIGIERLELWQVIDTEHLEVWGVFDGLQQRGDCPVCRANPLSTIDMIVIFNGMKRCNLLQKTGMIVQALRRKLSDIAHLTAGIVSKRSLETAVKVHHGAAQTGVRHMCCAKEALSWHAA